MRFVRRQLVFINQVSESTTVPIFFDPEITMYRLSFHKRCHYFSSRTHGLHGKIIHLEIPPHQKVLLEAVEVHHAPLSPLPPVLRVDWRFMELQKLLQLHELLEQRMRNLEDATDLWESYGQGWTTLLDFSDPSPTIVTIPDTIRGTILGMSWKPPEKCQWIDLQATNIWSSITRHHPTYTIFYSEQQKIKVALPHPVVSKIHFLVIASPFVGANHACWLGHNELPDYPYSSFFDLWRDRSHADWEDRQIMLHLIRTQLTSMKIIPLALAKPPPWRP